MSEAFRSFAARTIRAFPHLTELEQRLGLELYRLLLRGEAVGAEALAAASGTAPSAVLAALGGGLRNLVLYDADARHVTGYGGLSIKPTVHEFRVGDSRLYTWCAWDSLFIPELIQSVCRIRSTCPETGDGLELRVGPNGTQEVTPPDLVMSFLAPEDGICDCPTAEGIAAFCDYVRFLATPEAGEQWVSRYPGVFVITVDEGMELARALNRARYSAVLAH